MAFMPRIRAIMWEIAFIQLVSGAAPRGPSSLGTRRPAGARPAAAAARRARRAALQRLTRSTICSRAGRRRHDLLSGDLAVDRLHEDAAVLVLVARGIEALARELVHELLRERHLAGLQRDVLAELDLVEAAHLVGVVEAVERHAALHRAHEPWRPRVDSARSRPARFPMASEEPVRLLPPCPPEVRPSK
jgi:hypothetical protein